MPEIKIRDVRLPRLPRPDLPPHLWVSEASREFEKFFKDLYFYLSERTFVPGVHTEVITTSGFTITPETTVVFLTASVPVTSDSIVAIKTAGVEEGRALILVNLGPSPIVIKHNAKTRLTSDADETLDVDKRMHFVFNGVNWIGGLL